MNNMTDSKDMPEVLYVESYVPDYNIPRKFIAEEYETKGSKKYLLAETSISLNDIPEGCTPADAKMLRKANHDLVVEHEAELKQKQIELLDDVVDMLNKESRDPNADGVYRWWVPLYVAVDEIVLLKQRISQEGE